MKNRNILIVWLLFALLSIAVFLYMMFAYWLIDTSTLIESGFTDELADFLQEDYGVTIPENATFISGENDRTNPQEPYLNIFFEFDLGKEEYTEKQLRVYVLEMMGLDPKIWGGLNSTSSYLEDLGYQQGFSHKKHTFTSLYYKVNGNKVECAFSAYRPRKQFD